MENNVTTYIAQRDVLHRNKVDANMDEQKVHKVHETSPAKVSARERSRCEK